MTDIKKRKIPISILLIIIILLYIGSSIGILVALLDGSPSVIVALTRMLDYINYSGSGVIENIALLIIPAIIIFLINIKKIEIDKSILISRILSFVSIIINLWLIILNLVYITWLNAQPGVGEAETGIFAPILIFHLIDFVLFIVIYLLMTIKVD